MAKFKLTPEFKRTLADYKAALQTIVDLKTPLKENDTAVYEFLKSLPAGDEIEITSENRKYLEAVAKIDISKDPEGEYKTSMQALQKSLTATLQEKPAAPKTIAKPVSVTPPTPKTPDQPEAAVSIEKPLPPIEAVQEKPTAQVAPAPSTSQPTASPLTQAPKPDPNLAPAVVGKTPQAQTAEIPASIPKIVTDTNEPEPIRPKIVGGNVGIGIGARGKSTDLVLAQLQQLGIGDGDNILSQAELKAALSALGVKVSKGDNLTKKDYARAEEAGFVQRDGHIRITATALDRVIHEEGPSGRAYIAEENRSHDKKPNLAQRVGSTIKHFFKGELGQHNDHNSVSALNIRGSAHAHFRVRD